MRIFITGANGFIGGAVASVLIDGGHHIRGLVRDRAKAETVRAHGIEPVIGSLDDSSLLQAEARGADGVVNAANSGHRAAAEALIAGLSGSGKPLVHTSGTSIVADKSMGEPSDRIFHEGTPITPEPERAERVAIDRLVLGASGIRSIVLCNSMIYGHALGAPAQSVQVPVLAQQARTSGVARYIGRGLNRWSNVHIADAAALYALAIMKAPAGSFIYVESGEEALGKVVEAIAVKFGLGTAQSWPAEAAIEAWGREKATFSLGSNSRVRGTAATEILGWAPRHRSITEWIASELV
jgi:nucleoside-diphosphate-sugar epimerase